MIDVSGIRFANDAPLVLIGGVNVLESLDLALEVGEHMRETCARLGVPYVFKASFDKANRSSMHSFRGPGLHQGLEWLAEIRSKLGVPILTDVHEPHQAGPVAEVCDILQLPAFLSRQTDLVRALGETGAVVNVKKAQFLAHGEMRHILSKFRECGNERILLCERGNSFGYHNLVVDMLGFPVLKELGAPVVFDVTHSLQLPGGRTDSADGRGAHTLDLARAGVSQGIASLFLEAHPDPSKAKCDGPSALRLADFDRFIEEVWSLDQFIKSRPTGL